MDLIHSLGHDSDMEVNIHEARTNLSKLLQRVALGEEVIIAKAGVPVAKLVPIFTRQGKRPLGLLKGQIWMADDFNAPLPEDLLAAFYGEEPTESKPERNASRTKRKSKS